MSKYSASFWTRMELGLSKYDPPYTVVFKKGWAHILKGGKEVANCNKEYFNGNFEKILSGDDVQATSRLRRGRQRKGVLR